MNCPAEAGSLTGETDVGDFLADFARSNGWNSTLRARRGKYEVFRLGSNEIKSGQNVPIEQRYQLEIDCLDEDGINARFVYRDVGNVKKPSVNKFHWSGRIIDTGGVLFLVGVTEKHTDVALFILWSHPQVREVLIGLQLAKLEPGKDSEERLPYGIARPIVAMKTDGRRKADPQVKEGLVDWLRQEPRGLVVSIEPVSHPGNTE